MDEGSLTDAMRTTLALFDDGGEPQTTTEIADRLDLGRRATYGRLDRLVERERLRTKKVGANARVWWRPVRSEPEWPAAAESLVEDVLDDVEVGIFVLDETFEVAWINGATERYFGIDRERALGRDKRELVADRVAPAVERSGRFESSVLATYDDNTYTERFECHVTPEEGRTERWLEHRSKPVESGAYAGGRVELYYDVTERVRSERARREEHREFASLVEAIEGYAIVTLDPDGHVETWNPGAERIKGYEAEAIVGEHFSTFYTEADRAAGVPAESLETAAERGSLEAEGWRVRADGTRFWADVTITAIRGDDGELKGYAKVTHDVTERRARERRLARQHDELVSELDEVFERVDDAFYALDEYFRFTYVNDRAEELLGRDRGDLLGRSVWRALDVEEADPIRERFERAMATQESSTFERFSEPLGIWETVRIYPSPSGLSVYFRDITERKETEMALSENEERLRLALEAGDLGVWELDLESGTSPDRSPRHDRIFGYEQPQAEWSFERFLDHVHPADRERVEESFEAAFDTGEWRFECRIVRADGAERWIEGQGEFFDGEGGEPERAVGVVNDVTERVERERELEESKTRYQTLVEHFPNGAVTLVDADLRYVTVGGTPPGEADVDPDELEGRSLREVLPADVADLLVPRYEAALDGEAGEFEADLGDRSYEFRVVPVRDESGAVSAVMGMSQDVTGRRAYEDYLEDAKSQLEAATEAGAIGTWEWHAPEDRFVAGTALARQFGVAPAAAREGVSVERFFEAVHEADRARVEREVRAALDECGEYESEYRVRDAEGELRWVVARGSVECDEDGDPVSFPGALTDITERKRTEIVLERQREQLAALNNLNEVVRETTEAVIEQSTREEIERTVCERLAATDSYLFAWIGDVDARSETVNLRTEAGVEGYLDGISISVDPDDERSGGPTGRALRTSETQISHDIRADERHDPWRSHIEEYGFQSSAAVPIVHEGTTYGVLNVYAERPRAFDGREGAVLTQLGEVVGHAIAAAERKRALMSDELVELEFRIRDVFAALGVQGETGGRVTLDHFVPVGDDEFLVHGTATDEAVETVRTFVEALPHWEDLSVSSDGDPAKFELRLTEPPVLSAVASQGGYVQSAVIEDGDYLMRIHLAPSVDVRRVIDAVEDAYPTARMLRRRQISRDHGDSESTPRGLIEDLTERQRVALEAAYHAGFFEWPRDASGESVAESLGVAAPTFHQHLRKAERKVFESIFSSLVPQPG
ncbi:PAS domain S-box protein [Halosimplex litoreum]|uniref:histidine kinase n=1 Tax=Halosimplex litoreum TaxID=1198301 RepID=A0A7T3FWP1_9EURY|nr:PAS domain S-box protein [Halosimplex litoreum]QPV62149.1 PAS domain S-box protein [Halosimplex litoreum]